MAFESVASAPGRPEPAAREASQDIIWTGCYTADGGGQGEGIGAVRAAPDGTLSWLGLATKADSPSFLAVHPSLPVVYAVGEQARTVHAYRRSGAFGLEPAGPGWTAGEAPCHVAVDPLGRYLTVACWGDGQVLLFELDDDGGISARFAAAASTDSGRPSRAHASLNLEDGRVMTTDLGHDLLRIWKYLPGAGLALDHEVVLPRGSGPRHLAQHTSGSVFVVTEYSVEVAVVQRSAATGIFRLVGIGPATQTGALPGDSAAEIALTADGRHAYVGVRGSNRMSVLQVEADGSSLQPLADFPSGGDWPRHHLVRNGWLHVAHERSHDVVTFPLDPGSGLPGDPAHRLALASPTALVPAVPKP
ncbi:6-phosphogluconolactonase [Arthrobacter sp. V4I6]|uniref:lactonase family protein n=1 Tax=unclassified Arthrobacter TaxID=235627 RepID=UPI00278B2DD5|nr:MULTISPECIES: beta-propeller fold lactonase family protein [unclassified Arthrobacter]MDQ0823084.1 6-phosphogluconolactonase [Arthrobacter sp. V1I7]MDQ0852716.1 6-phosphogluconolactonase [Arthrobacter sp. V4I6]